MNTINGVAYITKIEHFSAAHRLYNPTWSDEKNVEVFDKCANPNFHGHNYKLYVTVKGVPANDTGFVFNAKVLSNLIKTFIIDKVDHKNLNIDVEFMKNNFTTVENLCIIFWQQLKQPLKENGATLHKIKLQETDTIIAEYYGE